MSIETPIIGRHFRILPNGDSLGLTMTCQPYVNRGQMSARAVISNSTIDRVGDVLIPRGCQITNFVKNPVVLWAHGLEGISQPIATSRAPDGSVAITITEDDVQATSWFSQKSLEAAQIFELIDEGIVRATSVRETPLKSHVSHDPRHGDILIVEEWDLEEWSWCAVGVNPDAVAKTLHRNRLGGQPIVSSIFKSLSSVAPTPRRFGVGFKTETTVSDTSSNSDIHDLTISPAGEPAEPGEHADTNFETQPYGSTVVSAAYASLSSICQNITSALGPLENPTVKEGLQAILASLQEQLTAIEGLHSSSYPDQPTLKSDDVSEERDDQAIKAFLATSQVASLRLLGLGARLKSLMTSLNLSSGQRHTLSGVSLQLAQLVEQSKSHLAAQQHTKLSQLRKSILELTELVDRIKR